MEEEPREPEQMQDEAGEPAEDTDEIREDRFVWKEGDIVWDKIVPPAQPPRRILPLPPSRKA